MSRIVLSDRFKYSIWFGGGAFLLLGDIAAFKRANRTIAAWVKVAPTGTGANGAIFGTTGGFHYMSYISQAIPPNSVLVFFDAWLNATGGFKTSFVGTGTLHPSQWFHYAVSLSESGNNIVYKYYVNGKLVANAPFADGYNAVYGTSFRIGSGGFGSYVGNIAEEIFVSRVMTDAEIKDLYEGRIRAVDIPNVTSVWDMHEGTGTTAADIVSGYDGTFNGTLRWSKDVPYQARRLA